MAKYLSIILVLFLFAGAFAESGKTRGPSIFEIADQEKTKEPIKKIVVKPIIEFSGEASVEAKVYRKKSPLSKKRAVQFRLEPVIEFNFSETVVAKVEGDFKTNNDSQYTGMIDRKTRTESWAIDFPVAWIEWKKDFLSLRIGKQIFDDWSTTDAVFPMSVLNSQDLTNLVDPEEIGIPAITFGIYESNWYSQLVFVPFFTPSELPRGRFEESLPVGLTGFDENWDENQSQIAWRIGGYWNGFNLSAVVYKGVSINPYGMIDGTTLKLNYSKQRVYGGSISREIFGGIIAKSEFAFYEQDFGDDFFQWVIGARREFPSLFKNADELSFLVQYSNEKVTSEDSRVASITDFRREFKDSILSRVSYGFSKSPWEIEVEGVFSLKDGDYLLRPKAIYSYENWKIEFGYQKIGGPQDSFCGKYDKADAAFLKIVKSF